ncbi:hypothetical protein GCM10022223_13270 [Kineosporia mesophila]|uniref:Integral membrane protein n=1 Tax=Kineosporia mesophila TaxID=566012 RepID=A0ABP6Z5J2_9ACTN|nr:hypothetical protein [Kineosporia mesophila]MCD5354938.1 hypothetical protein [Kineosporia mesophila]
MTDTHPTTTSTLRGPGHDLLTGGLRFLSEIVAWVGTPWALWSHSIPLAVLALVLLIVPSAIFSTPGDRPGGDSPVAVHGIVTILLLLIQLVAATAAAWVLWPAPVAIAVTALCVLVTITEQPRWHSLMRTPLR